MAKKEYNEYDVIRILNKKTSVKVNSYNKTIEILVNPIDLGNSSYGKIDYLVKIHHYTVIKVDKIINKTYNNIKEEKTDYNIKSKRNKINIVSMVKNVMKRNKK